MFRSPNFQTTFNPDGTILSRGPAALDMLVSVANNSPDATIANLAFWTEHEELALCLNVALKGRDVQTFSTAALLRGDDPRAVPCPRIPTHAVRGPFPIAFLFQHLCLLSRGHAAKSPVDSVVRNPLHGYITIGPVYHGFGGMKKATCNECGLELEYDPTSPERVPCPTCGSTRRSLTDVVGLEVNVSLGANYLHNRAGTPIGFGETEHDGKVRGGNLHEDGSISELLQGTPPRGEQNVEEVCRILFLRLNSSGADWTNPTYPDPTQAKDGDVDCRAESARDKRTRLEVQVVNARIDPAFWKKLQATGQISRTEPTMAPLVASLRAAIEKKEKIPTRQRGTLVLALDATHVPATTLGPVVQAFLTSHGLWAASLGFKEIWLVGPQPELTWQLDPPEEKR
jgi:hypothetical protein